MNKTMEIFDGMKKSWSSKQKELKKERLFENIKKEGKSFSAIFHFDGTNRSVVRSTPNACRY